VDDGCKSLEESLACARRLVAAGYTHSFCTPHVWPDLAENTRELIPHKVALLQMEIDAAHIPLRLMPGGEIGLRPETVHLEFEDLVSYGMRNQFCLVDLWAEELPAFFEPAVKRIQSFGAQVILAHPERMRAVQKNPTIVKEFVRLGLLLQGNLQCLDDPAYSPTRQIAEKYLTEGRYFMLGSDLHNLHTLDTRLRGLTRAIELVGEEKVWTLTRDNPAKLAVHLA
jgi:protein-tyrosine phosphatase